MVIYSIISTLKRELATIKSDKLYFAVLVILPLVMVLFFGVMFRRGTIDNLPIAVVDDDNSPMSRRLISMVDATSGVEVAYEPNSMAEAEELMLRGKAMAIIYIDSGFARDIYSGVTVDAKCGSCRYKGYKINITDLPGTYALSAYTPEELYVRQHLINELPDVVINAVVASNLERNLYLTTELIDLNPKMVVALNMYDELEGSGAHLDYEQLGRMIGVPVVPVVARDGKGLNALLDEVILTYENQNPKVRHIHINYSSSIETEIKSLSKLMKRNIEELPKCFPPRYWAIKMLEGDSSVMSMLKASEHFTEWKTHSVKGAARIITALDEDVESAITNEKYGFIEGALAETYVAGNKKSAGDKTSLIDRIVTHRYLGFPLFLAMMFLMFWSTFTLGAYPQAWIEAGFSWLSELIGGMMSDGPLRDLLVDGIIGGVGSVGGFLPNFLILS